MWLYAPFGMLCRPFVPCEWFRLYEITNKSSWGGSVADGTFTVLETALTLFPSAMSRVVPPCSAVLESALHAVVHAFVPSAAVSPRDLCAAGVCASVCSLAARA